MDKSDTNVIFIIPSFSLFVTVSAPLVLQKGTGIFLFAADLQGA